MIAEATFKDLERWWWNAEPGVRWEVSQVPIPWRDGRLVDGEDTGCEPG
jgi:hypothetical protein